MFLSGVRGHFPARERFHHDPSTSIGTCRCESLGFFPFGLTLGAVDGPLPRPSFGEGTCLPEVLWFNDIWVFPSSPLPLPLPLPSPVSSVYRQYHQSARDCSFVTSRFTDINTQTPFSITTMAPVDQRDPNTTLVVTTVVSSILGGLGFLLFLISCVRFWEAVRRDELECG